MASSAPNTIILRSNNPDNMMQRVQEAPCQAAVTILPGQLLAWGTTNTVKPHATANGALEGRKVAVENPWSDHGSGKAIDHAYAAGETVAFIFAQPGDVLYMWLEDEGNVAKGAPLAPNGSGDLQAITVDASAVEESVFGYAEEPVNNTGGSGSVRIRVRVA